VDEKGSMIGVEKRGDVTASLLMFATEWNKRDLDYQ
jgi:hypothetical protein